MGKKEGGTCIPQLMLMLGWERNKTQKFQTIKRAHGNWLVSPFYSAQCKGEKETHKLINSQ